MIPETKRTRNDLDFVSPSLGWRTRFKICFDVHWRQLCPKRGFMRVIPRRFFNTAASHKLPGKRCRNYLNRPQERSWNGPGIATPEDVESVYQFSLEWMKQVLEDPTKANLVVHCFAGVSRSSAMALIPLLLYYSSFRLAYFLLVIQVASSLTHRVIPYQ